MESECGAEPVREAAIEPPVMPELYFWLQAAPDAQVKDTKPTEVVDSGPFRMSAPNPENGPYYIPALHGKTALLYPHTKVGSRRDRASGILHFGCGRDWNFMVNGTPFTLLALFRPNVPCYAPYYQQRSKLLRIGGLNADAAFTLAWSNEDSAVTADH